MDVRVRYTKMIVREAFFKILKDKPLEKITVKEVCDVAQINRATFYKYYENVFDLLNKLEEETLDNLEQEIGSIETDESSSAESRLIEIFHVVLKDFKDKQDMYTVLFALNGDEMFRKRIFDLCYGDNIVTIQKYFPNMSPEEQEWMFYFIAEGCNGILNRWIKGGMKESTDTVAEFLRVLIAGINNSFIQK